MGAIKCFLLTPTDQARRTLRRFAWSTAGDCTGPLKGYHNADVPLDVVPYDPKQPTGDLWPHVDPRWPTTCASCSYEFTFVDEWQLSIHRLFQASDGSGRWTLRDAPVGAIWWADWLAGKFGSANHKARGNGQHLIVKTPDGEWDVDAPATNGTGGGGWDREGDPPIVTVRPSIQMRTYHGWLTNGLLVEC